MAEKLKPPAKRQNKTEGRSYGLRGIGVCAFVAGLFADNERLPQWQRLSDEKIRTKLLIEYGHLPSIQKMEVGLHETRARRTVGYFRTLYNLGELLLEHNHQPPPKLSHRYAFDGSMANRRTGRPLDKEGLKAERRWEKKFRAKRAAISAQRSGAVS